jgi:hypothetical protein
VVLFKAGDQVPVMPFSEVVGNGERAVPAQIGPIAVKVGVTIGFTTMVMVVVEAH